LDEGVLGLVEVGAGVAAYGRIATADMAALKAHAQVNPRCACFKALLAAFGVGLYFLQVFRDVGASRRHKDLRAADSFCS
jgi:hypothetical protein